MDANGIDTANSTLWFSTLTAVLTILFLCTAPTAHAITLTFDELTQLPCTGDACSDLSVDNQYSGLGVTFSGAGLYSFAESNQLVTPPNGLSDVYGPGLSIRFSGTLPKAFSVYVSSSNEDSVGISVAGANGPLAALSTDGWNGSEENSTPYRDKQLVTFSGSEIARIDFASYYDRRGAIIIDNLKFGDTLSVPLPASAGLFAIALGGLIMRTRRS